MALPFHPYHPSEETNSGGPAEQTCSLAMNRHPENYGVFARGAARISWPKGSINRP